jgi:hypothetical protein
MRSHELAIVIGADTSITTQERVVAVVAKQCLQNESTVVFIAGVIDDNVVADIAVSLLSASAHAASPDSSDGRSLSDSTSSVTSSSGSSWSQLSRSFNAAFADDTESLKITMNTRLALIKLSLLEKTINVSRSDQQQQHRHPSPPPPPPPPS